MNEHDYLFDPSAPPDPEIAQLEERLRPFAFRPDTLPPARLTWDLKPRADRLTWLAAAASLAAVAGSLLWFSSIPASGWDVEIAGRPGGRLEVGQALQTQDTEAVLSVGELGYVTVERNSRVKLLSAAGGSQRMSLERGAIKALITAPPRVFQVETPAATAVDLGCAYSLNVDEKGNGLLHVTVGWVAFEAHGRESFVPAGAACHTRKGYAPGTPFFADASEALQDALAVVDFDLDAEKRAAARKLVLTQARSRDALTLWHLLSRGSQQERSWTYDRLRQLIAMPAAREAVLQLDRNALDAVWEKLGLESAPWWRRWRSPAPPSLPIQKH